MLYFGSLSSNILVSDCLQRHQEAISARWPAVYIHFLSTNRHHHHQSHHLHSHHHDHHWIGLDHHWNLYNHHHFTHFHTDHHHIFFCSYLIYKQIILRHRLVQVGLRGVLLVHRAPWIQQFSESHYFLGHPLVTVAVYTHFLLTNRLHHLCNFVWLMIIKK